MLFRHLVSNWIRQQATDALQERLAKKQSVADPSEEPVEEPSGDEPVEAPLANPDLGFVFALGIEAGGVEDLMTDTVRVEGGGYVVRRGNFRSRPAALILSGVGGEPAAKAVDVLLEAHRPRWVVSAGFAGGLSDRLKRNDILMVQRVVDEQGGDLSLHLKIDPASLEQSPGVVAGTVLSVDRLISDPEEKRGLGDRHDALAVDMETYRVVEACRRREIPVLAVRIVLDTADDRLPADLERLMQSQGQGLVRRAGALAGTLWKRPSSVKDMYQLKEKALVASDRLARFLGSMVEQLP